MRFNLLVYHTSHVNWNTNAIQLFFRLFSNRQLDTLLSERYRQGVYKSSVSAVINRYLYKATFPLENWRS